MLEPFRVSRSKDKIAITLVLQTRPFCRTLSDIRRVGGPWGLLADVLDALIHLVDDIIDMDDS